MQAAAQRERTENRLAAQLRAAQQDGITFQQISLATGINRTAISQFVNSGLSIGREKEETLQAYIDKLATPQGLHSICEDYRASATIDLGYDKEDLGRITEVPLMVMCGEKGCLHKQFDVIGLWKKRGRDVQGSVVPNCGHYIPEDAPEAVISAVLEFMS